MQCKVHSPAFCGSTDYDPFYSFRPFEQNLDHNIKHHCLKLFANLLAFNNVTLYGLFNAFVFQFFEPGKYAHEDAYLQNFLHHCLWHF